jgi:large subunit ribosomal protein L19
MATAKKKSTKPAAKAKRPAKKVAKAPGQETDLIRRVITEKMKSRKVLPEFSTGDTVGVYVRVKEGEKERVQLYRGVVVKTQGTGLNRTFTVRKISAGVGVERTFPIASMAIDRVELISTGKVRRGRLFYLRGLKGRSARLDSELYQGEEQQEIGAADEVQAAEEAKPAAAEAASAKEKSN